MNCDIRPDKINTDRKAYLFDSVKVWYQYWQPTLKQYLPKTTSVIALPIIVELNTQKSILQVVGIEHNPAEIAKQLFVHQKSK